MAEARAVIDSTNLPHLVERIVALIPTLATEESPGLIPALSGNENEVLYGTGVWGEQRGGGGGGPFWLEVDGNGDLWAYYDDNFGPPNLVYDEESGNLYATYETEV